MSEEQKSFKYEVGQAVYHYEGVTPFTVIERVAYNRSIGGDTSVQNEYKLKAATADTTFWLGENELTSRIERIDTELSPNDVEQVVTCCNPDCLNFATPRDDCKVCQFCGYCYDCIPVHIPCEQGAYLQDEIEEESKKEQHTKRLREMRHRRAIEVQEMSVRTDLDLLDTIELEYKKERREDTMFTVEYIPLITARAALLQAESLQEIAASLRKISDILSNSNALA